MNDKIILLRKTKSDLWKINKAYEIVNSCKKYNHENIPEFIMNYARLKEVI